MNRFGFEWPESLDCSKFPTEGLCVGQNQSDHTTTPNPYTPKDHGSDKPHDLNFECPPVLKVPEQTDYQLQVGDSTVYQCGMACDAKDDVFFPMWQRKFVRYWVGAWAFLCMCSTFFTVLTFLVDMQRFRYPERPIIFLSGCYFVVSVTYFVGFFLGKSVVNNMEFLNNTKFSLWAILSFLYTIQTTVL